MTKSEWFREMAGAIVYSLEKDLMIADVRDDHGEAVLKSFLQSLEANGYGIYPKEPTEKMLEAYQFHFVSADRFDPKIVWAAMLKAYEEDK